MKIGDIICCCTQEKGHTGRAATRHGENADIVINTIALKILGYTLQVWSISNAKKTIVKHGTGRNMIRPDPKNIPLKLSKPALAKLKRKLYYGRASRRCETCEDPVELNEGRFNVFRHCHLSHIIPRPRGGDGEDNVKIQCFTCHIEKGHLKWRSDKKENP